MKLAGTGVETDVIQLLFRPAALCEFDVALYNSSFSKKFILSLLYRHCPVCIFLNAVMDFIPHFF